MLFGGHSIARKWLGVRKAGRALGLKNPPFCLRFFGSGPKVRIADLGVSGFLVKAPTSDRVVSWSFLKIED